METFQPEPQQHKRLDDSEHHLRQRRFSHLESSELVEYECSRKGTGISPNALLSSGSVRRVQSSLGELGSSPSNRSFEDDSGRSDGSTQFNPINTIFYSPGRASFGERNKILGANHTKVERDGDGQLLFLAKAIVRNGAYSGTKICNHGNGSFGRRIIVILFSMNFNTFGCCDVCSQQK